MLSDLSKAVGLAMKAQKALKDSESNLEIASLVERLLSAHQAASELYEENKRLEERIRRFEDFEAESNDYHRDHLENGAAVYRHDDYADGPEERNRYCCACFENQKIATLQPVVEFNAVACADGHTIPVPVDTGGLYL